MQSPETFIFSLPYPSKSSSDPLPLGSLVAPSTSTEDPGLVTVMPVSGKISYWESISSASTLGYKQPHGKEETISGMFSGEKVIQIVNAGSAGFVLVFSSGRLAYMNVRDGHGRPAISVQFLRNGLSNTTGGIFGSIRHVLSTSPIRGDIAAVRASSGIKVGERMVVAATAKGKLLSWRVHRGGHHELITDIDIREKLAIEIQQADSAASTLPQDSLEVLDFTFIPRGLEKKHADLSRLSQALLQQEDSVQHLLLLTSFSSKRQSRYSLVEVVISPDGVKVGDVRPLTSYTTPVMPSAVSKPRIYLPRPGLVAFVLFDRAAVIASMVSPPDSPESQLQEDSHIVPATFEDVVDFSDVGAVQIIGSGVEEPTVNNHSQEESRAPRHKTKNPATVLLLPGVGTIRIAISDIDRFTSDTPPEVTAKSKLEQAVFFGIKEDNPLVFHGRRTLPFSNPEICNAALELSHEIVSSKTPFMSNVPASLEVNMRTRGAYLDMLIRHLKALNVQLDSRTRWILLYNAEKMAVATWIWQKHEEFITDRPKGEKTLIAETAVYINENQKTEPNPAIGEVDPVRHWFINDVWRLDLFIAWGYQIIKIAWQEKLADEADINRLVWEAVTINNGALREAHRYREEHANLYGIDSGHVAGGNAIPEPWTATHWITNNLKRLLEFCYQWLDTYYVQPPDNSPADMNLLDQIRDTLPSLTRQYLKALKEFASWASKSEEQRAQELCKTYRETYTSDVYDKILKLKDYSLWDQAIELAEEFNAHVSLADLVVQEILTLEQDAGTGATTSTKADGGRTLADVKKQQMGKFMEKYQQKFAFRAYEVLLENSGIQAVLDFPYDKTGFSTKFLRTKPELAKISWINDVQREKDIDHAAETLMNLGLSRELQLWNKKIELSLGKLALLAEEAEQSVNGDSNSNASSESDAKNAANVKKIDEALSIIKIQNELYGLMLPTISEAVDQAAELQLAMDQHATLIPKRQKALLQIFHDGMDRLLKHEALHPLTLIDLLTMATLDDDHFETMGDQFFLALKVAEFDLKGDQRVDAQRLIWRRCFLRTDWKKVNETNDKRDSDQLARVGDTAAYRTMFAIYNERKCYSLNPIEPRVLTRISLSPLGYHDDKFHPFMKPSDAAGVYTDTLDRRFDDMDDGIRNKLLDAMRWEDNKLRTYIDKAQLDAWWVTTRDCADTIVKDELNQITAAKAARNEKMKGVVRLGSTSLSQSDVEEDMGSFNGNGTGVHAKRPFERLPEGERIRLFAV